MVPPGVAQDSEFSSAVKFYQMAPTSMNQKNTVSNFTRYHKTNSDTTTDFKYSCYEIILMLYHEEDVQIKDPPTELRSKVLLVGSKLGYNL